VRLSFSVPNVRPVVIEVMDVLSRRVVQRHVEVVAPGRRSIEISTPLPPGVYLVRLTQGDRSTTQRMLRVR
jgi:hypothetical protein